MTFSDLGFAQRFGAMGDEAESVFEQNLPIGPAAVFGWRRPDVSMQNMTPMIRYMPDFYTSGGKLVEVMGCNGKYLRGLKVDKWEAMKAWDKIQPVMYFIWNRKHQQWVLLHHTEMIKVVAMARKEGIKAFENDGNKYYEIQWEWLTDKGLVGHATP